MWVSEYTHMLPALRQGQPAKAKNAQPNKWHYFPLPEGSASAGMTEGTTNPAVDIPPVRDSQENMQRLQAAKKKLQRERWAHNKCIFLSIDDKSKRLAIKGQLEAAGAERVYLYKPTQKTVQSIRSENRNISWWVVVEGEPSTDISNYAAAYNMCVLSAEYVTAYVEKNGESSNVSNVGPTHVCLWSQFTLRFVTAPPHASEQEEEDEIFFDTSFSSGVNRLPNLRPTAIPGNENNDSNVDAGLSIKMQVSEALEALRFQKGYFWTDEDIQTLCYALEGEGYTTLEHISDALKANEFEYLKAATQGCKPAILVSLKAAIGQLSGAADAAGSLRQSARPTTAYRHLFNARQGASRGASSVERCPEAMQQIAALGQVPTQTKKLLDIWAVYHIVSRATEIAQTATSKKDTLKVARLVGAAQSRYSQCTGYIKRWLAKNNMTEMEDFGRYALDNPEEEKEQKLWVEVRHSNANADSEPAASGKRRRVNANNGDYGAVWKGAVKKRPRVDRDK
eukprot:comp60037_c0_seq1/m.47864 comp60037_c0_seq1/g.47864  ORF comp60037_c0_seq1/g.47864 comp60037_c0_seq1/m.47864 type:complete len:509 (-) comp60037_c0_seq1:145-1671(-)